MNIYIPRFSERRSVLLCILLFVTLVNARSSDRCHQPKDSGICRMSKIAYYFNSATNRCESFYYGGCGGNRNNFNTLKDCQNACHNGRTEPNPSIKGEHCSLSPITIKYSCAAFFRKFTFNSDTLQCESYVYGGCGGSANLYDTIHECLSSCVHGEVGVRERQHQRPAVSMFRSIPNAVVSKQEKDAIIFPKWTDEDVEDICQLPPVFKGRFVCTAFIPRWTYDSRQGKCVQFTYGGCRGSKNNFESKEACEVECPHRAPPVLLKPAKFRKPDFCSLPAVQTPSQGHTCLGLNYAWTFNKDSEQCEQIIYGGCGGTKNLFSSRSECQKTCVGENEDNKPHPVIDVCSLPIDPGTCRGSKTAFGLNKDTHRCERFTYGGCDGNGNRFESLEKCFEICGGNEPDDNAFCSRVKCDKPDIDFHLSKACVPKTLPGECCPSSWDCSFWENVRLKRLNECFHVSPNFPHGKFYKISEHIVDYVADYPCIGGAVCKKGVDGKAEVAVALNSCGFTEYDRGNCVEQFNSTEQCCPSRTLCGRDMQKLQTCQFEGKTYRMGEQMSSERNPCLSCLCHKGFNENNLDKFCKEIKCRFLTEGSKLIQNCVPVERKDTCCPTEWICPTSTPNVIPDIIIDPLFVGQNPKNVHISIPGNTNNIQTDLLGGPGDIQIDPPHFAGPGDIQIDPPFSGQRVSCPPGIEIEPSYVLKPIAISPEALSSVSIPFMNQETKKIPIPLPSSRKSPDDCFLPPAVGPCKGFRDKFYFNMDTRQCLPFKYGGFDEDAPGFNVFKNKKACQETCFDFLLSLKPHSSGKPRSLQGQSLECKTPPGSPLGLHNLCLPLSRKYRYDAIHDKCESFTSGLCGPGPNRFGSKQECELKCVKAKTRSGFNAEEISGLKPDCNLHVSPGNCRSRLKRFYYSPAHGRCKVFYYTGCQGNKNNFLTAEECDENCITTTRARSGLKEMESEAEEALEELKNPCDQPKKQGLCKAMKPSYYYDKEEGVCKYFHYGGCFGNANRFSSLKECSQTCQVTEEKQISKAFCSQPADPGKCFAIIRKWHFDPEDEACKLFFYGGCEGNGNRFDSKEECMLSCSTKIDAPQARMADALVPEEIEDASILSVGLVDPCLTDKKTGDCRAAFEKYYFDKETKECKKFHYGGCQGNGNNFVSKEICEQVCSRHLKNNIVLKEVPKGMKTRSGDLVPFSPSCLAPLDVGQCRSSKTRFYFNAGKGVCEKFVYGGCHGNENNYLTEEECLLTCLPDVIDSIPELKRRVNKERMENTFCHFGNNTYNLGDSLKLDDDSCTVCTCSSPPTLSCSTKQCPLTITPVNTEGCVPKYDDQGCCQIGYECNDRAKPCSERACLSNKFKVPHGQVCKKIKDKQGCCILGIFCVPKEDLIRDL